MIFCFEMNQPSVCSPCFSPSSCMGQVCIVSVVTFSSQIGEKMFFQFVNTGVFPTEQSWTDVISVRNVLVTFSL